MNKNIKLAVAGAVLALSASAADAGIIIPAGEWTLDISGNVNTFATWTKQSGSWWNGTAPLAIQNDGFAKTTQNMTTGLLPNYLSVSGSTRQNDLDVAFTISINPGSSTTAPGRQTPQQENRQAFLTFGDKSWGSVKVGKDLGIFASDAILNDMTLLGVGSGAGGLAGNTTTLGHIGTGYIYADWKAQIAYTTPNFSGFQATVGLTQAWDATSSMYTSAPSAARGGAAPAFEGKASYSFAANDVTGKVWVSGISQKLKDVGNTPGSTNDTHLGSVTAYAGDIGANVNLGGFGLTGYYYAGNGIGQTFQFRDGVNWNGKKRDSDGGYIQATYVLPTKTKLGASWGVSHLDGDLNEEPFSKLTDTSWTLGAYHPLTKHLNLVAEYNESKHKDEWYNGTWEGKARTVSAGAILFF